MSTIRNGWLEREDSGGRTGEWRVPSRREASREDVLGDWLGDERQPSVFADLRPMKTDMEAMIHDVLSEVGQKDMLVLTKLQDSWAEIVGVDNAKMSRPLSLVHGCLRVRVLNSSFKFMFERQLKPKFLVAVQNGTDGYVEKLEFV